MHKHKKIVFIVLFLLISFLLFGCFNQESKIEEIYNELFKDVDLTNIIDDLDLKTNVDGVSITYKSNNPNILTNDGKVTRGLSDEDVTVDIALSYKNTVVNKQIVITVLRDETLYLNHIYDNLFKDIDLNNVTTNLDFVEVVDDVFIQYDSTNPSVISNQGVITRGSQTQEVLINVTLTYKTVTINKELYVTVLKKAGNLYPIINAINANLDDIVTVKGVIIGKVGNSYFLHDGADGIYLYSLGGNYAVGNELRVTGTKTIFNGLIELKDFSSTILEDNKVSLPNSIKVNSLSEINKQATLYSIDNLKIIKIDTIKSGKDSFITVEDSNNKTMDIIISKHLDSLVISQLQSVFSKIKVGDKVSLTNIISSYYNGYQLQITQASQISPSGGTDIVVTNPIDPYYPKSSDMRFLVDELDEFLTSGINPIGTAKVLIIPISFTDYKFSETDLSRLEKAFFGTSLDTGWESVRSYYYKSSYGKFIFDGDILNPFQVNKPSTYYANKYNNGYDADYEIIKAALEYYDPVIDYSEYDYNNDGYIDGLYFIYAAPTWYGEETGSVNDSDLWWAYVYQYYTEEYELYDGVEANYYLWAGVDFMDEVFTYDDFTDEYIAINSSTYIHETGHMLGLVDYYDYEEDEGPNGGLGRADMMDYGIGDHNSFSKIMLDWVTPLVVSGKSTSVVIESFTETGDVILVSTNWNNSYFDEYFLIELYTPTHLNQAHAGFNGLYSITGIRIFHVNAKLNPDQSDGNLYLYDNSYTDVKLLKIVEADNNNSIERTKISENSDLFQTGSVFGNATNYRLTNGSLVNFNIYFNTVGNGLASITIEWIS